MTWKINQWDKLSVVENFPGFLADYFCPLKGFFIMCKLNESKEVFAWNGQNRLTIVCVRFLGRYFKYKS